jgi:putative CRISPR-associated protein (TIGR02619 family)
MTMAQPHILLCTVGTSLFYPNLQGLTLALREGKVKDEHRPAAEALAAAFAARDWPAVAGRLGELPPAERLCGAEINSLASLVANGHAPADCGLFFFHSATPEGRDITAILRAYFLARGHAPVEAVEVEDLQDADPKRFRTKGLRNLARELCRVIRSYSPAACAINATGGYKAQIAVAVLLGQALGVPVYYMHERFSEIIAFPPLPVALDYEVWMRASAMLFDLEGSSELVPAELYEDGWDERYESLVERVAIDGRDFLELSATGQIFHETFRDRFRSDRDRVLPPPVPPAQKQPPQVEGSGHMPKAVKPFLQRVTTEVPQVTRCATFYHNPDLPRRTGFRLGREGIEGVLSDGTWCVKFRVDTSAQTPGQQAAVVAALNEWLARQR